MFIDSRSQGMVTSLQDQNTWNTFPGLEYCIWVERWWNKAFELDFWLNKRKIVKFTINSQYTTFINHQKRLSRGILQQAKGNCLYQVHSDQTVLGTVKGEAGPSERRPKALKTKLALGGLSGSSPLRSDSSHDGQAGGWTSWEVAKDAQGRVGKQL